MGGCLVTRRRSLLLSLFWLWIYAPAHTLFDTKGTGYYCPAATFLLSSVAQCTHNAHTTRTQLPSPCAAPGMQRGASAVGHRSAQPDALELYTVSQAVLCVSGSRASGPITKLVRVPIHSSLSFFKPVRLPTTERLTITTTLSRKNGPTSTRSVARSKEGHITVTLRSTVQCRHSTPTITSGPADREV